GNDVVTLSIQKGNLVVDGLASQVVVRHFDPTDSVRIAGLAGTDKGEFDGGKGADQITIAANGALVRITGIAPTQFSVDTNGVENVVIAGHGGNDVITAANGFATLTNLTIPGGTGNDTIVGGDGGDILIGGNDNDSVRGGRGNDV